MAKHAFESVQLDERGRESILERFTVTRYRPPDMAYKLAEMMCEQARKLPHKPAAFVREVGKASEGPQA